MKDALAWIISPAFVAGAAYGIWKARRNRGRRMTERFHVYYDRITGRQVEHNPLGWYFAHGPQEEDAEGEPNRLDDRVEIAWIDQPPKARRDA